MLHNAIERILEAQCFWADPLGKLFVTIFGALYRPVPALKDFLNGVWFGHPLHPAITAVPIGASVVPLVPDLSGQPSAATPALGVGCAHEGCSLSEGKIVGETIECGCDGARYRLHDGLVVRGPAVFDQPHFEVREAGGKIEVRRTDTR